MVGRSKHLKTIVSVLHGVTDPLTSSRSPLNKIAVAMTMMMVVSVRTCRSARLTAAALRWHSVPFAVSDNNDPRKPDPIDCGNSLVSDREIEREREREREERERKSVSVPHVIVVLLSHNLFALCQGFQQGA